MVLHRDSLHYQWFFANGSVKCTQVLLITFNNLSFVFNFVKAKVAFVLAMLLLQLLFTALDVVVSELVFLGVLLVEGVLLVFDWVNLLLS